MAESEASASQVLPPEPAPSEPPAPISISDILNDIVVLHQKEDNDKYTLDAIGTATHDSLRAKLVTWAMSGFPNAYPLMEVAVTPPTQCSDGVVRGLADYIVFCSGKTIQEHVALVQAKLVDIPVSFANMGYAITIVVSKA